MNAVLRGVCDPFEGQLGRGEIAQQRRVFRIQPDRFLEHFERRLVQPHGQPVVPEALEIFRRTGGGKPLLEIGEHAVRRLDGFRRPDSPQRCIVESGDPRLDEALCRSECRPPVLETHSHPQHERADQCSDHGQPRERRPRRHGAGLLNVLEVPGKDTC
ncbi:MAG TPA: hypothetical protein VEK57_23095 [Thermoanaerobaculia bacterium]|nr:hypothetical protein [Thermoanaerobaculia bacterium]